MKLSANRFSTTKTPAGSSVDEVPVVSFLQNPVIWSAIIGGLIGLLKKWADANFFDQLGDLGGLITGDIVLFIVIPALVVILELNRKSLTSLRGKD